MSKDLELLKEDEHYYGDVGKKYISASDIKTLNETPNLFRQPREENVNFLLGRYFHTLMLEPEKLGDFNICEASTRNTKIYKEYFQENGISLLQKEVDLLHELKEVISKKDVVQELIYSEGNEFEIPAVKEIHGVQFKGKADVVNHQNELVIDLKTTADISRFKWSARDYYYNSQAWIYRELFGYDVIFIVICKKTKTVQIFTCSDKFYEDGENRVLNAIENYQIFYGDDSFEDVDQFVEQIEL